MAFFDKFRKQTAIVWKQTAGAQPFDEYGWRGFQTAVDIAVRWDDTQEEFTDSEGRTQGSNAVVMVGEVLSLGDYMLLGTIAGLTTPQLTDPDSVAGTFPIRKIENTPTINGSATLREATL